MKRIFVLAFAIACSTNARTNQPDRVKEDVGPPPPPALPTAIDAASGGLSRQQIEDALHGLGSEHGAADVKPLAWWKANASAVRPYLRAMLEDDKDDGQTDRWAIRILGDLGDGDDVALLAKVLTTWKLDTAREHAASALGVHPAPAARDALIEATRHANVDTASYAASGLGSKKGDDAARARLEELLDHADSTIRYRAVNALAEVGGGKAALEKRKKVEKDAEVKAAIVKALKAS